MKINELFEEGQNYFCYVFRQLIFQNHPKLFEKLDFYNDDHFNDPLLFGFFNGLQGISIEQILEVYLKNQPEAMLSDEFGNVYFPGIGYYHTDKINTSISLAEADFAAPILLERHNNIEVCLYSNAYYTYFLRENGVGTDDACINNIPDIVSNYLDAMNSAFDIIKTFCPDEYQKYINSTKRIVLYEKSDVRSFVTRQVHGTIFLSVNEHSNVAFFIEEFIHQCSHNVFNAITADVREYLLVEPETYLSSLIDGSAKEEVRDIFGAYHGVYTVSTGVSSILPMILSGKLDEELQLELLGRLAIKKPRFRTGIERVDFDKTFTKKGKELYDFLDTRCYEQMQQHPNIFGVYNFANQGAVFSFQQFMDLNGAKVLALSK